MIRPVIIKVAISGLLFASTYASANSPSPARIFPRFQNDYQTVFDSVNPEHLQALLKDMTGVNPVTIGGQTFAITDRYLPASKEKFRRYFRAYFEALGVPVQEQAYPTRHNIGETMGHNMEAVMRGKSADSIVIIVHYDSMGPRNNPAGNPGVDDDMTGMATMLETARILAQYQNRLHYTVRFVASDYEEFPSPRLEGATVYAHSLRDLAQKDKFNLIAAIDDEQIGWNCSGPDHKCRMVKPTFNVFSCSTNRRYNYQKLGDQMEAVVQQFAPAMAVKRDCIGPNSDHYAMWDIGVPAVVFSELNPFDNPHFDNEGGDTYDKIDQTYFFSIARVGVTFAATVVGIE